MTFKFITWIALTSSAALASEVISTSDIDVPDASRLELQKMLDLHRTIQIESRETDLSVVDRKPAIEGPPVYSTSENDSAASEDSISESPVEAAKPN